MSNGTTTINASAPNVNSTSTVLAVKTIVITFNPGGTIDVPSTASVPRAVHLSDAAPRGGLLISFQAADPTIASTTPVSVTVAEGQLDSPLFRANGGARPNTSTTLTASATGATSGSVTVQVGPPPAITTIGTGTLALGMQHTFSVSLNFAAPDSPPGSGGLVVSLNSSGPQQATVPAQVIVPTGQTSVNFTGVGKAVTKNPAGVDQPVTITATAPGFTSQTAQVSVVPAVLQIFDVTTPRTTSSPPQTIRAFVLNSACQFCFNDVLSDPLTVKFAVLDAATGGASTIVSVSPTQVTIPALDSNTSQVQSVTLSTPSGSGQYVIAASATGLATATSITVTTTQTGISSVSTSTLAVGLQHSFSVTLDSPAPDSPPGTGGLIVALQSSGPQATVRDHVIVPTGLSSVNFTAAGVTSTKDLAGVDHPVTITATTGSSQKSANVSVVSAVLQIFDVSTPRTTSSPPQTIRAFVLNSACQFCFNDVLSSPLTVMFSVVDPNTGNPSSIVTVSPTQVTIPALDFNTSQVQSVTLGTPSGTGQYAVNVVATGFAVATSPTVTVTQTAISGVNVSTLAVGMQHSFTVGLDSPAPDSPPGSGGLVVALKSSGPQATVPDQVIVPTGLFSVNFTAVGVTSTRDQAGVDHPVTITASSSTSQKSANVSVAPAVLQIFDVTSPRSTFSQPQNIRAFVLNSACNFCFNDVLTNPLTVTFGVVDPTTGNPSSIVTVSPTQVTIPALESNTGPVKTVTLTTPSGIGQYAVTASAPNLPTATSLSVSATEPSVTSISSGTLAVGMQHPFSVSLDSVAPAQGVVINLASSDSSLVSVPQSVTIPGGQQSANFTGTGVALPPGVTSQTVEVSASAQGVTGLKVQVSIVPAVLSLLDLQTARTTFSPTQTIRAFVLNSACQFCFNDVLVNPLTVTFTAIDPNTGSPSNIVTVSPSQVTIPALDSNTAQVQAVTLSTPSATGSYAIVLSAQGFPSVTSSTVTVTPPHVITPSSGQTLPVAALMHRTGLTIQLDSPAPAGGLTMSLSSPDMGSKFTVPATVTVPAGDTSTTFTLTGLASTHDQQGFDHPATLTFTPPQPWIGSSTSVSVTTPTFTINGIQTSRTLNSAADPVSINVLNPACNCGDVLNSATAIGLSIQSTTSGIATVNPASVSAAANGALSSVATISPPGATGTYTLIVSADGFTTFVSAVVTVQ